MKLPKIKTKGVKTVKVKEGRKQPLKPGTGEKEKELEEKKWEGIKGGFKGGGV